MISQARNHPPSSLDNPWSLGSCLEKGISADVIVPIQRQCLHYGRFLTTRRARWYSVLHPVLFPLLERAYPEQEEENQILERFKADDPLPSLQAVVTPEPGKHMT